jgi:hypothetical protein
MMTSDSAAVADSDSEYETCDKCDDTGDLFQCEWGKVDGIICDTAFCEECTETEMISCMIPEHRMFLYVCKECYAKPGDYWIYTKRPVNK